MTNLHIWKDGVPLIIPGRERPRNGMIAAVRWWWGKRTGMIGEGWGGEIKIELEEGGGGKIYEM